MQVSTRARTLDYMPYTQINHRGGRGPRVFSCGGRCIGATCCLLLSILFRSRFLFPLLLDGLGF